MPPSPAQLTLSFEADDRVRYVLDVGASGPPPGLGHSDSESYSGPPRSAVDKLNRALHRESDISETERTRILQGLPGTFAPQRLMTRLDDWVRGSAGEATLMVSSPDPMLARLPWPEILATRGIGAPEAMVVHTAASGAAPPSSAATPKRMLVAGWARFHDQQFPGITRELTDLSTRFDRSVLDVVHAPDPTQAELEKHARDACPHFVHLSPPAILPGGDDVALPVTGVERDEPDRLPWEAFLNVLGALPTQVELVVVNACHSVYPACARVCEVLGIAAVGWPSWVGDDVAADFSSFFYQRLVEGMTVVEAVRSFARSKGPSTGGRRPGAPCLPVIWCPPSWVSAPLLKAPAAPPRTPEVGHPIHAPGFGPPPTMPQPGGFGPPPGMPPPGFGPPPGMPPPGFGPPPGMPPPGFGPPPEYRMPGPVGVPPGGGFGVEVPAPTTTGPLKIDFRPVSSINPALLVNGRSPIEHLLIDSPKEQTVRLRFDCDTGSSRSTYRQTLDLKVGVHPSIASEICFPALHELADRKARRRRVLLTLTIEPLNAPAMEVTKSVLWMGADEWLDRPDTWQFIPAFIDPRDPAIADVVTKAVAVLRTIGRPDESFSGYPDAAAVATDPDRAARQMRAIFQTLRDDGQGIRYATPLGGRVYEPARERAAGQIVRRHAEVLERRLGTCHDLSLLLAACAEYVGIHPLVVLARGHTFIGFWRTHDAHRAFWKKQRDDTSTRTCAIANGAAFHDQVKSGHIELVETTFVCQPKSYEEARAAALDKLTEAIDDTITGFDVAIDVVMARTDGIQPV